jgi:5'-deoxynucleotidase YfbR-like HD superfamily hydrolase
MDKILPDQLKEPYIRTHYGTKVEFLNPKPDQIKIDEIAWHLAGTCRFNALMHKWYSTAEHSILGTSFASNKMVAKGFLIHDAAEFVFSDIPSPVSRLFPDIKAAEHKFQEYIYKHYNVDYLPIKDELKEIDNRMTATEMYYLRDQTDNDRCAIAYHNVTFHCWERGEAFSKFMQLFKELF